MADDLKHLQTLLLDLQQAVARSDLVLIETLTRQIADWLGAAAQAPAGLSEADKALVREMDGLSEGLSDEIASRLRAYGLAIEAWRTAQGKN
ncbi:MAG: hypothetical protein EBY21_07780 [Alphaproteobacteria bacterium]|nr:hypothetical protein [Alphaproteobacteria bacterium]